MRSELGACLTLLMQSTSLAQGATPSGVAPECLMHPRPDQGFRASTPGYSWGNHAVVHTGYVLAHTAPQNPPRSLLPVSLHLQDRPQRLLLL